MKTIGICTDKETLKILKDQYKGNTSKSVLNLLGKKDFTLFLKEAYSDEKSIYKTS
ncbi:MAG: hypothetical protein Q8M71_04555 [Thermodesulfovibrionales bacterium]|nr:hypothetical protein [Thermodesulfovibrionales bacterium]